MADAIENGAILPDDAAASAPPPESGGGLANPASAAPAETPVPADETARLRDQLLRLQADFDNYRKRVARDDALRARRATERLIEDVLPVLDHFEMGLKAARDGAIPTAIYDGLALVHSQLLDVLKKAGVAPMEAAGTAFDPQCHECVAHLPSAEFPEGMIIDQTRQGYWLGDYLLRPAQVVVSSGMPAAPDPGMVADAENSMAGPLDTPP